LTFTANKYNLFGQVQPTLTLYRGQTYIFTHPSAHPFRISTVSDGTHVAGGAAYTTGVTTSSTTTTFVVGENTPEQMFYYCGNHAKMGGQFTILTS
jgi:hypothetical protein